MPRRGSDILLGLLMGLLSTGILLLLTSEPRGMPVALRPPPTAKPIKVHVAGAVEAPGVYQFSPGAIVQDALEAAGGPEEDANYSGLNLAALLNDGDQIYLAGIEETPDLSLSGSTLSNPASPASQTRGLININLASAAELELLPGIGPVLAGEIVDYRAQHGAFADPSDLMNVPGIGAAKLKAIEDLVTCQ